MILTIDMGNSNIVIGGIDEQQTYFLERITTNRNRTDLEYAVDIKNILEIHQTMIKDIDGAILSSVVPPLNTTITNAVKKVTGLDCLCVNTHMKTGLGFLMDHPETIGSDLIVDSVAAMHEYPLPLAVVDMGTATTITIVDENKNYIGGIIYPGIRVSLDSLSSRTAQLPFIDLNQAGSVIGKNTVDSMKNGILYGHAGMVDGILSAMEAELTKPLTVVATGGLAKFIVPLCKHKIVLEEDLLLKGLLILYQMNT